MTIKVILADDHEELRAGEAHYRVSPGSIWAESGGLEQGSTFWISPPSD
jgi:hypothetical protein